MRSPLIVGGDAARTASNIVAHAQLYRFGIVLDLLTVGGCVILNLALYELLAPVHRSLARLAVMFRMTEAAVYGATTVGSVLVLSALGSAAYLQAFEPGQLQALARLFAGIQSSGFTIAMLFLCVGSTTYMVLVVRSRYVPKTLPLLGIVIGPLGGLYFLGRILFPAGIAATTAAVRALPPVALVLLAIIFLPVLAFEVILGFWLLFKGVRIPEHR